jgi:hypothetical protein
LTLAVMALLVVGAATIGAVAVSGADDGDGGKAAATKAKDFTPKILKGKWTGEWENTTFGSTGDILANVKFKKATGKFTPLIDFSGNVFGCEDPPSDSFTIKEDKSKNKWTDNGFKVNTESDAFGDFKFTYKDATGKVTASGTSPCNPDLTFTMEGELTSSSFTGTADINLGNGQSATSTLSANED